MGPLAVAAVLVIAALGGGALGSFAGVVAARGFADSLGGRSRCDGCVRTLRWFELVPLVSYVGLRGRCRSCGARIGAGVYGWELAGAVVGVAVAVVVVAMTGRF